MQNEASKALLIIMHFSCYSIATYAVKQFEEHKEKIKNTEAIILKIPYDSVKALSWEYEGEKSCIPQGRKWLYDEDEAFQ